MQAAKNLTLVLMGLLILGGVAFLIAVRLTQWPRARAGFVRLGDAVISFALGLMGFAMVVLILRALGWLPPTG